MDICLRQLSLKLELELIASGRRGRSPRQLGACLDHFGFHAEGGHGACSLPEACALTWMHLCWGIGHSGLVLTLHTNLSFIFCFSSWITVSSDDVLDRDQRELSKNIRWKLSSAPDPETKAPSHGHACEPSASV